MRKRTLLYGVFSLVLLTSCGRDLGNNEDINSYVNNYKETKLSISKKCQVAERYETDIMLCLMQNKDIMFEMGTEYSDSDITGESEGVAPDLGEGLGTLDKTYLMEKLNMSLDKASVVLSTANLDNTPNLVNYSNDKMIADNGSTEIANSSSSSEDELSSEESTIISTEITETTSTDEVSVTTEVSSEEEVIGDSSTEVSTETSSTEEVTETELTNTEEVSTEEVLGTEEVTTEDLTNSITETSTNTESSEVTTTEDINSKLESGYGLNQNEIDTAVKLVSDLLGVETEDSIEYTKGYINFTKKANKEIQDIEVLKSVILMGNVDFTYGYNESTELVTQTINISYKNNNYIYILYWSEGSLVNVEESRYINIM